jgi:hypothetical protein
MTDLRIFAVAAIALTGCAVEDQAVDADMLAASQAPIPQLFDLSVDRVWGGNVSTFTIEGGPPNGNVRLVRAVRGAAGVGPCPPPLNGECLDINGPGGVQLTGGTISLNANGQAQFTVNIPAGVQDGVNVAFQAVAPAAGAGSNPFEIVTGPNVAPCVPDQYEPNDDGFGAIPAWPLQGEAQICNGQDFDWYNVALAQGDALQADIFFTHIQADVDLDLYLRDAPSANSTNDIRVGFLADGFSATDNETASVVAPVDGVFYSVVYNWVGASLTPVDYGMAATITPATPTP